MQHERAYDGLRVTSFEEAGGYRQADAAGFIRLNGLRLRIRALVERGPR